MDRSSTVARFIQRFREAAPLSPDQRRRDRQAMEGQFWWAQLPTNSEDGDFESDRSGRGTSSPPPPPPPPTQDGGGSNRDLEDNRSRVRAPPPYEEPAYSNPSKHKTLEASCKDATQQDARVESEGGCDPNTDQTTLASSALLSPSPCSPGPPGPPSDHGDGLHQLRHQRLAGEAEVAELAASLIAASINMPEHQVAASSFGASSSRLPERSAVAIEGEGCDELANLDGLDARAGSLLEHCRQLLSALPTDDAEQEAIHPLSASFSSGKRSSAVLAVGVGDGASSHTDEGRTRDGHAEEGHTRRGLEQRAWMLLDDRGPLEHWEANLHDSLLPTGAGQNLSPVRSNPCDPAAREAVPVEGLAFARTAEVGATHGSRTFRKKTISGLGRGESHASSSEQEKNEMTGDEGGDSLSLLLRKEFRANHAAPPCTLGGSDEAFCCGRTTSQTQQRYDREMALPELTSATGDLLTGMGSMLGKFTENEIPVGFDRDGTLNLPHVPDVHHPCRMTYTSPVEPSWAVHSNLGFVGNRSHRDISAMTPSARGGRQGDSSVASLKYFAEDPVIVALVERAHEIEAELERRRLFSIEDGNQLL